MWPSPPRHESCPQSSAWCSQASSVMCCLILGCCSLLCKTRTGLGSQCRLLLLSDLFRIIVFVLDDVCSASPHRDQNTPHPPCYNRFRMLSGDHLGVDFPGARQIRSLAERTRTSPGAVMLCATPLSVAFEMLLKRWSRDRRTLHLPARSRSLQRCHDH